MSEQSDTLEMLAAALAEHGVTLHLSDDGAALRLDVAEDAPEFSHELLALLRDHKAEIIALLRSATAPTPPPEPALVVTIGGKRQRLAVAEIVIGESAAPARPQIVHPAEVVPGDLTNDERARFEKARARRHGMTVRDATLLDARAAFGDLSAIMEIRRMGF